MLYTLATSGSAAVGHLVASIFWESASGSGNLRIQSRGSLGCRG